MRVITPDQIVASIRFSVCPKECYWEGDRCNCPFDDPADRVCKADQIREVLMKLYIFKEPSNHER